ncbi:MAG TPA: hypothetical protein VIL49_05095, partial [Capillimicrobium sp.]
MTARPLLLVAVACAVLTACGGDGGSAPTVGTTEPAPPPAEASRPEPDRAQRRLAALEREFEARVGVLAVDTATGR